MLLTVLTGLDGSMISRSLSWSTSV